MNSIEFLRQFRIGPYTVFDTALSYVAIYFLAPVLTWFVAQVKLNISRSSWLWLMLPLSVVFHLIFRQNTPLMKQLSNPANSYIQYIALLAMFYMGLRHVKDPIEK